MTDENSTESVYRLGEGWPMDSDATKLLQRVFRQKTLTIENGVRQERDGRVVVSGSMAAFGMQAISARIDMASTDTTAFTLTMTTTQDFRIIDNFINLQIPSSALTEKLPAPDSRSVYWLYPIPSLF